ncbi:MAG: hypothetical protein Kow00129_07000 [Thermoleophilia bacterium]
MNGIDFERAIKSPFRDAEWITKTLLGLVFYLLVVTAPAVIGAGLDYLRGVRAGEENRLPRWDRFGDQWVRGLLVILAGIIYSLPLVLLAVAFALPPLFAALAGEYEAAGVFGVSLLFIYGFIALIYGVALSVFFLAATAHYAVEERFGAFFEVGQIWRRVRADGSYWMAWLFAIALSILGSIVSSVLTATVLGILLVPAVGYLQVMMTAHLFGQWARRVYGSPEPPAANTEVPAVEG